MTDRPPGLARHGLIGDTASAALVAADGTIDWWCPGTFEAWPVLARLVDPDQAAVRVHPAGGRVRRRPAAAGLGAQTYDPGTAVLRTVIGGADGTIEVADFMPWEGPGHTPAGRIVRLVSALAGAVDVVIDVAPGRDGWSEGVAGQGFTVHTGIPMETGGDRPAWTGRVRLEAGQRLAVTIDDAGAARQGPLSPEAALRLLETTSAAWRSQVAGATYDGPYREAVTRSLLVVRSLTSSRGGGLVAAPTSSLPEQPGGERNVDARLCRTTHAAAAAAVLEAVGLIEAADGHRVWLAELVRTGDLPLAAAHAPDGGPVAEEEELRWEGFLRSQPVRMGWAPPAPPDLAGQAALLTVVAPEEARPEVVALTDWLAANWAATDLVADRLDAAGALERQVAVARAANPLDLDAAGWLQDARAIRAGVESDGVGPGGGLRRGGRLRDGSPADEPDATLLSVAWRGPWPPDHPIVVRTVDHVLARLGHGPALVERYPPEVDDGLPPGRPPSIAASFAAVRALAALGRWEEAHSRMEVLCGLTGPLGLAGEAADPRSGGPLGNFPSAEAHLALVDAATALTAGPR